MCIPYKFKVSVVKFFIDKELSDVYNNNIICIKMLYNNNIICIKMLYNLKSALFFQL